MTATTADDLRANLIGAWLLHTYEARDIDGSELVYPLGANARGIIMYTPDGYMSAQLMRSDRKPLEGDDMQPRANDDLAAAANGYLSYAGPYSIVDDGLVAHHIDVSLLPNWIGGTQYRAALLHDSVLELSPPEPILVGGKRLKPRLVWHRA